MHGVPKGSILGPLLFITHINNLPSTIKTLSEPIISADYTNVIISNKDVDDFCTLANSVFSHMSKWSTANKLALSVDKTKLIKFVTDIPPQCVLSIDYNGKYVEESANTKLLGLQIDNHLNWKNHIDQMIWKWGVLCS
jgi:hypothetical protein